MATEFIIKKGRSSVLFDEHGACRIAPEKLIENGWYLTTDTAEVYVCLRSEPGNPESKLVLKKINELEDLKTFIDEKSIALDETGLLSLAGFESAAHTTVPQKQSDGSIKWVTVADLTQAYTAGSGLTLTNNEFTVDTTVIATIDALNAVRESAQTAQQVSDAIDKKSEDLIAVLALKADASNVYTKDEANLAFMTQTEVDDRINALIVASDPEGGKTISDIQNLVKYVDENADDIAGLITATEANTNKLVGINTTVTDYVANTITAIVQPKASDEIAVAEDGTIGIKKVNVNKLVQVEGDTLVLDGGAAS